MNYDLPIDDSDRERSFRTEEDWQGIPWESKSMRFSREMLRDYRLSQYRSFRNLNTELEIIDQLCPTLYPFFTFTHNYPQARCRHNHFQLKKNVVAQDDSTIYITTGQSTIDRFDVESKSSSKAMDSKGVSIYSFDVWNDYIVCGGVDGELLVNKVDGASLVQTVIADPDSSKMTNAVRFVPENSNFQILASSNDCKIRLINPEKLDAIQEFVMSSCVNHSTLSNDRHCIAAALDALEVPVFDIRTNKAEVLLQGHSDFSFGVTWDPSSDHFLASCNQDHTVKIWDLRTAKCLHTLPGKVAAALNVQYSADGKHLAFSESIDFVHVFDTRDFRQEQIIDIFGEITGSAFSPNYLFVGVNDEIYCSLLEFCIQEKDEFSKINF